MKKLLVVCLGIVLVACGNEEVVDRPARKETGVKVAQRPAAKQAQPSEPVEELKAETDGQGEADAVPRRGIPPHEISHVKEVMRGHLASTWQPPHLSAALPQRAAAPQLPLAAAVPALVEALKTKTHVCAL